MPVFREVPNLRVLHIQDQSNAQKAVGETQKLLSHRAFTRKSSAMVLETELQTMLSDRRFMIIQVHNSS